MRSGFGSILLLTLAAVVAAVLLGLWWRAQAFDSEIARAVAAVRGAPAGTGARTDLPPLIADYLAATGLEAPADVRWFRVTQQGEMRLSPQGPWLPFSAEQHFSAAQTGFVWRASMTLGGFLPLTVVDRLVGDEGRLDARILGIFSVAHAQGPAVTKGQLLRYLPEIAWVPAALAAHRGIAWRQADERHVVARLTEGAVSAEVTFTFDERGDIVLVQAADRPRGDAGNAPTPWGAELGDYRVLDGVRVPTRGAVWWELPTGRFVYWRGTVTGVSWE